MSNIISPEPGKSTMLVTITLDEYRQLVEDSTRLQLYAQVDNFRKENKELCARINELENKLEGANEQLNDANACAMQALSELSRSKPIKEPSNETDD